MKHLVQASMLFGMSAEVEQHTKQAIVLHVCHFKIPHSEDFISPLLGDNFYHIPQPILRVRAIKKILSEITPQAY